MRDVPFDVAKNIHALYSYLEIYFQMQVKMKNKEPFGAEVLVRMHHNELGVVMPGNFIGLAEELGAISKYGDVVFNKTLLFLEKNVLPEGFHVSINVSPLEFCGHSVFLPNRWIDRFKIVPENNSVVIEITESALPSNNSDMVKALTQIHELGIGIAIDDFGSGFASLAYLKDFKVDFVKLDRSFVSCISNDDKTFSIVKGVIDIAHSIGVHVIAEGVETDIQHDMLMHAGCDYGQGFLYSRPIHESGFLDVLTSQLKR